VLIGRCAWHPRYYGHSKLLGVSAWRGLRIDFTDGICPKCAARVRVARQRRAASHPPAAPAGQRTSEVVVVALAVLTGLVLIARPANEGSTPVEVADLMPRAVRGVSTEGMSTARVAAGAPPAPAAARRLSAAPALPPVPARPAERLQAP